MTEEEIALLQAEAPRALGEVLNSLCEMHLTSFAMPMYNVARKGYSNYDVSRGWQVIGHFGKDSVDVQLEAVSPEIAAKVIEIVNGYFQEQQKIENN